eukprot:TRINITY_DN60737_c0_g1_i1.p1 TRINITY_DN60737_c0_g1~~TRINITY_DN60737_c0_g1_i1.p1  ORF type:complete len:503 (+),score=113.48 TRINITY_DN60737_c0_g1_i1:93-1511(+)
MAAGGWRVLPAAVVLCVGLFAAGSYYGRTEAELHELRARLERLEQQCGSGQSALSGAAKQLQPQQQPRGCQLRTSDGKTLDTGGALHDIALRLKGTDKIYPHRYDALYAKYVAPMAGSKVRMLEIGLGCDMPHGPGHSAVLWHSLIGPGLDYHVADLVPCTQKWAAIISDWARRGRYTTEEAQWARELLKDPKRKFWGDQANRTFLAEIVASIGGSLDIIIDDGGHQMKHQLNSFEVLFPLVRPGGIYVIEDLETSFYPRWGGTARAQAADQTTVGYLRRLVTDLNWRAEKTGVYVGHVPTPWSHWVRSVDCDRGICVLTRRSAPFTPDKVPLNWSWPCSMRCASEYCQCDIASMSAGYPAVPAAAPPRSATQAGGAASAPAPGRRHRSSRRHTPCNETAEICGPCVPGGGTSLGRYLPVSTAGRCRGSVGRYCRCAAAQSADLPEWFECCADGPAAAPPSAAVAATPPPRS